MKILKYPIIKLYKVRQFDKVYLHPKSGFNQHKVKFFVLDLVKYCWNHLGEIQIIITKDGLAQTLILKFKSDGEMQMKPFNSELKTMTFVQTETCQFFTWENQVILQPSILFVIAEWNITPHSMDTK